MRKYEDGSFSNLELFILQIGAVWNVVFTKWNVWNVPKWKKHIDNLFQGVIICQNAQAMMIKKNCLIVYEREGVKRPRYFTVRLTVAFVKILGLKTHWIWFLDTQKISVFLLTTSLRRRWKNHKGRFEFQLICRQEKVSFYSENFSNLSGSNTILKLLWVGKSLALLYVKI